MSVREIFGCFACQVKGGTDEPHRDFQLVNRVGLPDKAIGRPFGVGYVHERCRLPDDGLDDRPLCTLSDAEHYPGGNPLITIDQVDRILKGSPQ